MVEFATQPAIEADEQEDVARHASDARVFLLIDDDSMVGRIIGHAAESCGFRAIRTTTAEGFSRMYHAHLPDIVAVDLRVPGSDGVELLRFLAEARFAGPVIVISGLDPRLVEASVRLGEMMGLAMADPLEKPFRIDALEQRLAHPGGGETS